MLYLNYATIIMPYQITPTNKCALAYCALKLTSTPPNTCLGSHRSKMRFSKCINPSNCLQRNTGVVANCSVANETNCPAVKHPKTTTSAPSTTTSTTTPSCDYDWCDNVPELPLWQYILSAILSKSQRGLCCLVLSVWITLSLSGFFKKS